MDERAAAIGPLTEAYTLAFKVGDQPLAVEAWARRAWAQGTSTGGDAALVGSDIVQAVADQQAVPGFARALLYNNIGAVQMALEHRDRARLALERAAREAVGVAGPGATELLVVPVNLALVTEDTEKRGQLLTRAVAATAELLGADHPDTAAARWLQGDYTTRFADALEILAPTCSSLRPANDVLAKHCWTEVAFIRGELKQTGEAIAALTSAAAIQVAPDSDAPSAAPYLRYWQGDFETAADEFATVLRGLPRLDPEPWWDRQTRADLEIGLARSLLALGRAWAARAPLESAVQGLLGIEAKAASPAVERRLGRAQAELAKTLAVLRARPDQIRAHAAPAAAWLRTAGGLDSEIRTFERLALCLSRRAADACDLSGAVLTAIPSNSRPGSPDR
jgi:tetratricopeptide (TPR) repeat protein